MSTKSSAGLEADETAQKRAQWEQFSFDVEAPGMVEVTNESHDNPAEHQYVVTLDAFPSKNEDGAEPEECDCDGLGGFPCWPCVRTRQKELPK
nr:SWIM zinc finger family protein [Haladaptatus halobius]